MKQPTKKNKVTDCDRDDRMARIRSLERLVLDCAPSDNWAIGGGSLRCDNHAIADDASQPVDHVQPDE